ncbi:MAG: ATP-binding protein [Ruminococcus sp.]|nr:ATP-binding protein [Ruminococcus sp.]
MSTDFENKCKDISCTELWKIFREKCSEEEFVVAVGKVCEFGIEKSKAIIKFFPNFTLHDLTHIKNVCNWMTALLGKRADELTAQDAAMLLMSACCHDIGMSVSAEQEKKLEEEYNSKAEQREYVRLHHHERVGEHLTTKVWGEKLDTDKALKRNGIRRKDLIDLCKSHGEDLEKLVVPTVKKEYDLRLCAVLLRLADILDFDSSRAPQSLFEHMGLDAPENFEQEISQLEWIKNSSGSFKITDGELIYTAEYSDPNIEHKVNEYLKWVKQEIEACRKYISIFDGEWKDIRLPFEIIPDIVRIGYEGGDFQITMDQERIMDLLTGENLYSDPCVFVRELLQNSIDAILWRGENDPDFDAKSDGKIKITTWHNDDETGQGWFKIEDNGTGMDENIIKNYFLRAGRSYYTSDDFAKEHDIYSPDKTYKPISRFGIGILSCFMSDKNNKLEVSTKRYSHDRAKENPGLRLSVTGLKGYYTLAKENEQEECDWQKMPVPNEEEEYFRTEPGTTICVGMNLFDLEDYRSIKEVVDKYVQFPDITIEYNGFDGAETYPTKDEFMEAIAKLKKEHGDTCPIVRNYPIPDDLFEKLKKQYRELKWGDAPELVFYYYPLDNYTSGDDLSGVAVHAGDVDTKSTIGSFSIGDNTYKIKLAASLSFVENVGVNVNFSVNTPRELDNKIKELKRSDEEAKKAVEAYYRLDSGISKTYSRSDLFGLLSASEKKLLEYAFRGKIGYSTISYNGVFAGAKRIGYNYSIIEVRLLRGRYAPEVNVARDSITKLPIEAAVEFGIIDKSVGNSYLDEISYESGYYYEPEKKLSELIKKHSEWESRIVIKDHYVNKKALSEITKDDSLRLSSFYRDSLTDNIAIAFLKEKYSLSYSVKQRRFFIEDFIEDKEENCLDTSDFPVQMFFKFRDNRELLGVISYARGINVYSPEHHFSRWLIKNRKKLKNELPTVYKKILEIMIMSNGRTDIIKKLKEQLTRIKKYGNEDFEITYEFYLTEDDFAEYP